MNQTSNVTWAMTDQNRQISAVFAEQRSRLRNFIRRRGPDPRDAKDILQDAFYKLVEANRLLMPIDHVASWLFRVAIRFRLGWGFKLENNLHMQLVRFF